MYCDGNDGWTQEGTFWHQMIQNCVFRFTLANLSDFSQAATLILRPYQGGHFIIVRILRFNKELILQDLFYDNWVSNLSCFRLFFGGIWWWFDIWIHCSICKDCRWWGPSRLCHRPLYGLHRVSVSTLFWGQTTSPFPRYIFILLFFYSLFLKDSFISRSTYSQRTEAILERCLLKESFFS